MASKSTLLRVFLIFGLAAGQLIEVEEPANNNYQHQVSGPVVPGENDEDDAIIIDDPSKFPDPEGFTENIFPSNGGFQLEIPDIPTEPVMPNNGGFQMAPDYNSEEPITQKYEEDNGEIPIENWDWSRKTTKKPPTQPGELGGLWGSIVGGWQDAINSSKDAVVNVIDSVVDVSSKYLKAMKNSVDKLFEAKQKVLDKVHVNGKFLHAAKRVVDEIFNKKLEVLNNLHTKKKGNMSSEIEEDKDDDANHPKYSWNPANDVAGDIFDWVDFESDNHK